MPGHNSSFFFFLKLARSKWLITPVYSLGLFQTQLITFRFDRIFSPALLSTQTQSCHCLLKGVAEFQLPGKQDLWPHICQKIKQTRAHSHALGLEPVSMVQLMAVQLKPYPSEQPGQIQTAFWKQPTVSLNPRTRLRYDLGEFYLAQHKTVSRTVLKMQQCNRMPYPFLI